MKKFLFLLLSIATLSAAMAQAPVRFNNIGLPNVKLPVLAGPFNQAKFPLSIRVENAYKTAFQVPLQTFLDSLKVQPLKVTTATTTGAAVSNLNNIIQLDATGAAFTYNLPDATLNAGKVFQFVRINTGVNLPTIGVVVGGQLINGAATYVLLTAQYKYVWVYSNGVGYTVFSAN